MDLKLEQISKKSSPFVFLQNKVSLVDWQKLVNLPTMRDWVDQIINNGGFMQK